LLTALLASGHFLDLSKSSMSLIFRPRRAISSYKTWATMRHVLQGLPSMPSSIRFTELEGKGSVAH
jgi:hypothetical protein